MKDFSSKSLTVSRFVVNKQTICDEMAEKEVIKHLKTHLTNCLDGGKNSSVLQVLFKSESYARYKVEKFLKDLLEEGEEFIVCHPPNSNSEKEYEDNVQAFHIDKLQINPHETDPSKNVPVYSSAYEDSLENIASIKDDTAKLFEEKPMLVTCFNCLGNHHMKKCPDKLDYSRISINKRNILMEITTRYHTDYQNSSFLPGALSNKLRNALGLQENELPHFVYHMRVLGYPPGWMEEAIIEKSGLSLYGQDGKASGDDSVLSVKGTLYDGNKFIKYPGFNTPIPGGVLDEWKKLKMPPVQKHQQLEHALKSPNIVFNNNSYKRRPSESENGEFKKSKNVVEKNSNSLSTNESFKNEPARTTQISSITTQNSEQENKHLNRSKSVTPGTPILKQGNPFSRLPDADKFAQGITEYLPYENLPDAVGSFEKMRDVISTVQKKIECLYDS